MEKSQLLQKKKTVDVIDAASCRGSSWALSVLKSHTPLCAHTLTHTQTGLSELYKTYKAPNFNKDAETAAKKTDRQQMANKVWRDRDLYLASV